MSCACSGVDVAVETIASVQPRKASRPAAGMPSSSQMMIAGKANEKLSTRSAGAPEATMSSIRPEAICCARGRSRSTRRTVNARPASWRIRVCAGGSMLITLSATWPNSTAHSRGLSRPMVAARLNRTSPDTDLVR